MPVNPDTVLPWVALDEVSIRLRYVFLSIYDWNLMKFKWNALRALPTATLCLGIVYLFCVSGVL